MSQDPSESTKTAEEFAAAPKGQLAPDEGGMHEDKMENLCDKVTRIALHSCMPANPGNWEAYTIFDPSDDEPTPGTVGLRLRLEIKLRRAHSSLSLLVDAVRGRFCEVSDKAALKIFSAMGIDNGFNDTLSFMYECAVACTVLDGTYVEATISTSDKIADLSITLSRPIEVPDTDQWYDQLIHEDEALLAAGKILVRKAEEIVQLGLAALNREV